jgi:hypothetical protein
LSKDITPIVQGWEFVPGEMQVRIVRGDDGREKLQVRIDLGLLQLEMEGRPDGERPGEADSLLDHLEARSREAAARGEDFDLTPEQCAELMREGVQYYHRYLALFHLHRFDLVVRDTTRNLRLFAFVVRHATRQRDRLLFDQYRPYVTMMRARALGMQALERGEHREALGHIDAGIEGILDFLRDYEQSDKEGENQELALLRAWRREIERDRPVGPIDRLEQQLEVAVALENFEEAARLRDQIRRLRGPAAPGRPDAG